MPSGAPHSEGVMAGDNRRRDRRVQVPISIKYRITGRDMKDTWSPGVLANLAAGGLRFTCDRMVGEGDTLAFRLTLPTREEPYYVNGIVVWATPLEGGVDCGVAFIELSPDSQFELEELVEFLNTNSVRQRPAGDAEQP